MTQKEAAFQKISELVTRFEEQYEFYKNSDYNETLTRRDFIDPFFKALGWDVDNENGYAESYREVIHEDKVKVGKATKAPDYSFRLVGGKRLFFVEAKKPVVFIKDEIQPAYQVRRYGWNAKLPISILTDFEEFAVYDCSKKPSPTDKPHVARIAYFTFREYKEKFDFLWETFSKEQVLKGSFDRFVLSDTHKKGTTTVDKEFLKSLDAWRTYLATSISWNNKNLTEEEINYVVQQTTDRVIFLRIAEDRGIEPENNLKHCVISGSFYQNLFEVFKTADDKYNSGLFDFKKDLLSAGLMVDNKVIKNIIEELYYPNCEYEFGVMPVEILGTAYEQFLGKTIRITPAHHAKIEEKPEVRKAGGVYYTPQFIVDYIVRNTVGRLVENKTPKEVSEIKIVDPACGSGSFLLGAYQFLLDWHKDYYSNHGKPSKGSKSNPLTPTGSLTTAEKKRILLNNIYGVDIDVNAVEVTKLSLLLKCMEGETEASINAQFKLFNERVLPSLDHNIQSGNSLIDTDFYTSQLDFGEEKKVKPFNWQKAFPEVFRRKVEYGVEPKKEEDLKAIAKKAKHHAQKTLEYVTEFENQLSMVSEPEIVGKYESGFDAVIGNPPYVFTRDVEFNPIVKNYYKAHYLDSIIKSSKSRENQTGKINLFGIFLFKGTRLLTKNGLLGFIVPNTVLRTTIYEGVRKYLLEEMSIEKIVDLKAGVFDQATVSTVLLFLGKRENDNILIIDNPKGEKKISSIYKTVSKSLFKKNPSYSFNIFVNDKENSLFRKMKSVSVNLSELADVFNGIATFANKKGIGGEKKNESFKKLLFGKDIKRYYHDWSGKFIEYKPKKLQRARDENIFLAKEKLVMQRIGGILVTSYDNKQFYTFNSVNNILLRPEAQYDIKFILALLNSNLFCFYYRKNFSNDSSLTVNISKTYLDKLPVIKLDFADKVEENKYKEIVNLASRLLELNQQLPTLTLESDRQFLKGKIDFCENRINQLVYELYGLTEEEIEIVEGRK